MSTIFIDPANIFAGDRLRTLDKGAVERLKESIVKIGLKTPISIRRADEEEEPWVLVTGRHRLQACVELGFDKVEVREEDGTELDARLWEIAENLHRAELTVAERSRHIAEWVRLTRFTNTSEANNNCATCTDIPRGPGQPQGGVSAAARELGIERTDAIRAIKIDSLTVEAKAAAVETGLDNNQSALLAAAKEDGAEAQVEALKQRAAKRDAPKPPRPKAPPPEPPQTPDTLPVASVKENEPGTEFPELAEAIRKEGASDRLARAVNNGVILYQDARKLLKKTPEAQVRAIEKAQYNQTLAQWRTDAEAAVQLLADRLAAKDFARFVDLLERTDFFSGETAFSEAITVAAQSRGLMDDDYDDDDEPQEAA
jgi:hypothetical protein